jgi:hypothetical protein
MADFNLTVIEEGPIRLVLSNDPDSPVKLVTVESQGPQGIQGPTGPTGPAGADGAPGPQGIQGPIGLTGPAGPKGDTGNAGPTGATGADGTAGSQWFNFESHIGLPAGLDELAHPGDYLLDTDTGDVYKAVDPTVGDWSLEGNIKGATGPIGPAGPTGADGAPGPQGIQGIQGPAGADGAPGPQGIQGIQGPAGPAGPGATPSGANTQVQFNDAGAFGGDSSFTWDKVNKRLTVGSAKISTPVPSDLFVGPAAPVGYTGGGLNVMVGPGSGGAMTGGAANTAIGYNAGAAQTTALNNTMIGRAAGQNVTTGSGNVMIGSLAGSQMTTGSFGIMIGMNAGGTSNGDNTFAIGYNAGGSLTTGVLNTLMGVNSGQHLTTGGGNVTIGPNALGANVTGDNNVSLGFGSLQDNTGSGNTAIGTAAGTHNTGDYNVFIGYNAGFNITGNNKLVIDNQSRANPMIYGEFDNLLFRVNGKSEIVVQDPSHVGSLIKLANLQTANASEIRDNSNALLSAMNKDGAWVPPALSDTAAANNTLYKSTTTGKLSYKDPTGVVVPLSALTSTVLSDDFNDNTNNTSVYTYGTGAGETGGKLQIAHTASSNVATQAMNCLDKRITVKFDTVTQGSNFATQLEISSDNFGANSFIDFDVFNGFVRCGGGGTGMTMTNVVAYSAANHVWFRVVIKDAVRYQVSANGTTWTTIFVVPLSTGNLLSSLLSAKIYMALFNSSGVSKTAAFDNFTIEDLTNY